MTLGNGVSQGDVDTSKTLASTPLDPSIRENLLALSSMGVGSDELLNFGFNRDAVFQFCLEENLALPSTSTTASPDITIVTESNTIPSEKKKAGYESLDKASDPPPSTLIIENDGQAADADTESDMEISDISDQEIADEADVEDMDVEDTIGTSTIIMTTPSSAMTPASSTGTTPMFPEPSTPKSDYNSSNSTLYPTHPTSAPIAKLEHSMPTSKLLQDRPMSLTVDVSSESDFGTEMAYKLFAPVIRSLHPYGKKFKAKKEPAKITSSNGHDGTRALQATIKQIADMKKMIEQLEQSKKKEKANNSDGDSPSSVGVEAVVPASDTHIDLVDDTRKENKLHQDMEETRVELNAQAKVVVNNATDEQLSALKSSNDKEVTQLVESVEQQIQDQHSQLNEAVSSTKISSLKESSEVKESSTISNVTGSSQTANATKRNSSSDNIPEATASQTTVVENVSTADSPLTLYEEQLKSLQQLEEEQDRALKQLELKIAEMRKQQEEMALRKEQAKTKALGVRAKLSMLQRASASPKVRTPPTVSTQLQPMQISTDGKPSSTRKELSSHEDSPSAKRTKYNRPPEFGAQFTMSHAKDAIQGVIIDTGRSVPLLTSIQSVITDMANRKSTRPFMLQNTPRYTDTRHDHVRILYKPDDLAKHFQNIPPAQEENSDSVMLKQAEISDHLKDTGRSESSSTFSQYQSPLQCFRSFQYFGGKSGQSMAYSNPMDTSRNLCAFELAGGTCNDDTCASRHFRDFNMTEADVIQDLLTYAENESEDIRNAYQRSLKRIFASMSAAPNATPTMLVRTAADCRNRLSKENSRKVSFVPSPARRLEKVKRKAAQHRAKPMSQKQPITSALQPILSAGPSGEARYFDVDERNYPRDPKNIQGWVRACLEALPSANFADYDITNSKSLELGKAINVLRQALARNPTSELLWCLYVELWLYRGDTKMFEREMEQAIRNVPHCLDLLWYKVLAAPTVEDQITISDQLLEYFTNDQASASMDALGISSTLLEILCRQAAILIGNDRVRMAKQLLGGVLSSSSAVRTALSLRDQVLLGAGYFHVCAYGRLPTIIFRHHFAKRYLSDENYVVPLFIVVWNEALASSLEDILCMIIFELQLGSTLSDASAADYFLFLVVLGNLLEFLTGYPQAKASDIAFIKQRLEESNFLPMCIEFQNKNENG
ncbi:Zinc finger C3H1 domain-containing protein, variant 2 [Umbelopsis sp. WA50703]